MIKTCIICGKEYETNYKVQLSCSDECKRVRMLETERKRTRVSREKKKKKKTINDKIKKAAELGLTYSQLQQQETLELVRRGEL